MKSGRTMIAALVLLGAAGAASAKDTTLTGKVGDAMCGAKHMMADKDAMCTAECVKKGTDYALIVGDKVYTLKATDAQKAELASFAGKSVTVKGDENGGTMKVASIAASK